MKFPPLRGWYCLAVFGQSPLRRGDALTWRWVSKHCPALIDLQEDSSVDGGRGRFGLFLLSRSA